MTDPLAPLRARFRARAADELILLRALATGDLASPALQALAHGLAGAAGTFGYPRLSAAALAVDDCFVAGCTPDAALLATLEDRLVEVADAR